MGNKEYESRQLNAQRQLIATAVYQYRHGYIRGWSLMRQGRKRTRVDVQWRSG